MATFEQLSMFTSAENNFVNLREENLRVPESTPFVPYAGS